MVIIATAAIFIQLMWLRNRSNNLKKSTLTLKEGTTLYSALKMGF